MKLEELTAGMADLASKHKNDMIANALANVSRKLEYYNTPFAEKLDDLDKKVIDFYISFINKEK